MAARLASTYKINSSQRHWQSLWQGVGIRCNDDVDNNNKEDKGRRVDFESFLNSINRQINNTI